MELGAAGLQEQPFGTQSRPLAIISYKAKQAALGFLKQTYADPNGFGVFSWLTAVR